MNDSKLKNRVLSKRHLSKKTKLAIILLLMLCFIFLFRNKSKFFFCCIIFFHIIINSKLCKNKNNF